MSRSDTSAAVAAALAGSWLGIELWSSLHAATWPTPTLWLSVWVVSSIVVAAWFLLTRRSRPLATAVAYLLLLVVLTAADREAIIFGPRLFGLPTTLIAVVVAAIGGRYLATRTGPVRPHAVWGRIAFMIAGLIVGAALGMFAGVSIADIAQSIAPCDTFECGVGPALSGLFYGGLVGAIAGIPLALQATRRGIASEAPTNEMAPV